MSSNSLNAAYRLNNFFSTVYNKAQNPSVTPRETDIDYVHVSSMVNLPCPRKLQYQYFNKDVATRQGFASNYSQTIFKIGIALEQDRISTLIKNSDDTLQFLGTWRCACALEGHPKGISISGVKSPHDARFAQVCKNCNTAPTNYDEYQFKVDRIGLSGRPDLTVITKVDGEYMLNVYELKTVMKSDYAELVSKQTFASLTHIKQSCIYYYFYKDLIKQHKGIDFYDLEGNLQKITQVNPNITVLYIDKRDDRLEKGDLSDEDFAVLKNDWMKGCPNYFFVYNVNKVPILDKHIFQDKGYFKSFYDEIAIKKGTYIKKEADGSYYFSPYDYLLETAALSKKIKELKYADTLYEWQDITESPCVTRGRDGVYSMKKYKAESMDCNCPYFELCVANKKTFYEKSKEDKDNNQESSQ